MEFYNDASVDHYKPSIFELIAQEQLRDLLQPALKYVLAVRPSTPTPVLPIDPPSFSPNETHGTS
jgi:hypothetical protein